MTNIYFNENALTGDECEKIKKVILLTLEHEGFGYDAEISVTIVDDDEIKRLNKRFRGIDKATDVLSFPCFDFKGGDFSILKKNPHPALLGDIVISIETARTQAKSYGHLLMRELIFLACHAALHLLGFDHATENEEKAMFEKQKKIMSQVFTDEE
jgi:probable rRNA maturation factor